jgi:hypothetical protein
MGTHGGEGLSRDRGLGACFGWRVWVGSALKRERNGGKDKKVEVTSRVPMNEGA